MYPQHLLARARKAVCDLITRLRDGHAKYLTAMTKLHIRKTLMELKWSGAHDMDDHYTLYFICPLNPFRVMTISWSDDGRLVHFYIHCALYASIYAPAGISNIIASQNEIGELRSWIVHSGDQSVCVYATCDVPVAELDASLFRATCERLCMEAYAVHKQLLALPWPA